MPKSRVRQFRAEANGTVTQARTRMVLIVNNCFVISVKGNFMSPSAVGSVLWSVFFAVLPESLNSRKIRFLKRRVR